MSNKEKRLKKELFHLREQKRRLKSSISQSMSATGPHGVTNNCKDKQQQLSQVVKAEKRKKNKLRNC